jgi:predicted Zn-dependent protease
MKPDHVHPENANYTIGIMRAPVEATASEKLGTITNMAVDQVHETLTKDLELEVSLFDFVAPHLIPTEGGYSPFEFLRIGLSEKIERDVDFLLIISEVDLSSSELSYVLALPSQLTNVGIISTKRLSPTFWGYTSNQETTATRLSALMLHTLGHLLNLPHHDDPSNVMHSLKTVEDLNQMDQLTAGQVDTIRKNLSSEAREEKQTGSRLGFITRQLMHDWRAVWNAMLRANPFELINRLPTMIAAAGSAIVIVFFTAEIWDVASAMTWPQLFVFSLFALIISTLVLYRAFSLHPLTTRRRVLMEAVVITSAATQLTLFATTFILYLAFATLAYLGTVTIFPSALRSTWTTVTPIATAADHVKLSSFLAGVGVLAGSLGGRADSKDLVRYVLFLDEET